MPAKANRSGGTMTQKCEGLTAESRGVLRTAADGGVSQAVSLRIILARDVRDGKAKGAGQLTARPMQRVEARTATGILPPHLPDHDFGVRVDVKFRGLQSQSALQRLH